MDLIYTNANGLDVGIVTRYTLDQEESTNKSNNTFQITSGTGFNNLELGSYVYADGTELGGRITGIKINTSQKKVIYSGITWRGMLTKHIVKPPVGQPYAIVSGQLEAILLNLIRSAGMTNLFHCESRPTVSIPSTKIDRYTDVYSAMVKLLSQHNYKLVLSVKRRTCTISAEPIVDYSNESELSSDMFDFTYETQKYTVNHLIGLGQGELENRQVVHRYVNANGEITTSQYYYQEEAIEEVYDYPNVESLEELERATEEELAKKAVKDSLKVTTNNITADVGDKFTAIDLGSGMTISQFVTSKIIVVQNDLIQYQYKVGDKAV